MTVVAAPPTPADGQKMSWDQHAALDEEPRAEHVGGKVLVSPSPDRLHRGADVVMKAFEPVDGAHVATAHVTVDEPADVSFGPASLRADLRELSAGRRPKG